MSCEHKRLKSVNCVLYCADCGARIEEKAGDIIRPAARDTFPKGEGTEKPKRTRRKKTEEDKV